jgi:hypothetical protein
MANKWHILKMENTLHVLAVVFNHLQGVSVLKGAYSSVVQLVGTDH